MSNLITPSNIERYIDASDNLLDLYGDFLTIWNERGSTERDVAKAIKESKKIFWAMIDEDQKREIPHINGKDGFYAHSWGVGESAANWARELIDKDKGLEFGLTLMPGEIKLAFGGHDKAKFLAKKEFQSAHEHVDWLLLVYNNFFQLANLVQPHQPGEERVLRELHNKGYFLEISEAIFCRNRLFQGESDLGMLADMSFETELIGLTRRMYNILSRYNYKKDLLAMGIVDSIRGAKRMYAIEDRLKNLGIHLL